MFNEDHKYFKIAEKMKDHLLLDYVDLIEKAKSIILTDSGFFSLAIHLKIETNECYFFSRENETYNYTYEHIGVIKINRVISHIKSLYKLIKNKYSFELIIIQKTIIIHIFKKYQYSYYKTCVYFCYSVQCKIYQLLPYF